jgi:hypothetical protein
MKGVSHGKRLKPCSLTSGTGEQFLVSMPGEANHRAVAKANLNEPRNTIMRAASVSETSTPALSSSAMKPVSMQESTTQLHGALRGQRGQRDGKELLGTWENPRGACGVSRVQPVEWRINKSGDRRWGVGEVHSSDETGESQRSEGTLAVGKLPQKRRELIGR